MAQGDQDTVIPRDLLDRTRDYLTGPSGGVCLAGRYPNSHDIPVHGMRQLVRWLSQVFDDRGGRRPGSHRHCRGRVTGGA